MTQVSTGLQHLLAHDIEPIQQQSIGLITNRSATTADGTPSVDALLSAGARIRSLFAPEHGFAASLADGEEFVSAIDKKTGLHVYSLYGSTKKPTPDMLEDIDAMVFDIQDVGARFYTFLYTMAYAMEACAEAGKQFIILDRPNPITGTAIEGPLLDAEFASFAGLYPIPIRYGMTIGEIASLFSSEFGIGADLMVIPLQGWRRSMWFDQTNLSWMPPSPNIPHPGTALVYPGTCLIEGTNISEGRGTSDPFRKIGAPWIDGMILASELRSAGLPGVELVPAEFTPSASKHEGRKCGGVSIQVINRDEFESVLTGLKIIEVIHRLWPKEFAFREPGLDGRCYFDLLAGTDSIRLDIESGKTAEYISENWQDPIDKFRKQRERYLIYD